MNQLEIDQLIAENKMLKEELVRKNTLINHIPCTVSWINKDLKYIAINRHLKNTFLLDEDQLLSEGVGFLKNDSGVFYKFIKGFFESDKNYDQIEYTSNVNGAPQYLNVVAKKYDNGNEAVVMGIDISEQKELEERLKNDERFRIIAEMATGILHEIKNPLSVIKGSSDLLTNHVSDIDRDTSNNLLERINRMSDRVLAIVDGLKNLSRDGNQDSLEPTPIHKIIEETTLITKFKLVDSGLRLDVNNELSSDEQINCREGQIIQVLVNLINNACDAISELPERSIKLRIYKDSRVNFQVIDSGTGISNDILEKIFTPFFTTKPKEVGTGLGLGICKDIMKAHGGDLEYKLENGHTSFIASLKP